MTETNVEPVVQAGTDTMSTPPPAAETITKQTAETVAETSHSATAALQELTKAYQELASRNVKNLTAAIQSISTVKSLAQFIELEQKLIKEGVEAAVSDSKNIARLTSAVFTAALDPIKKRIEAAQKASAK